MEAQNAILLSVQEKLTHVSHRLAELEQKVADDEINKGETDPQVRLFAEPSSVTGRKQSDTEKRTSQGTR